MCALRDYLIGKRISTTRVLGLDAYGQYESVAEVAENGVLIESRHYVHPHKFLWRREKTEDGATVRSEEFRADGSLKRVMSFDETGEWIWDKTTHPRTMCVRLAINRDCFLFFGVPADLVLSLEDGKFVPEELLNIKWEGVREVILEILGAEKVIPELPMTVIDSLGANRLLKMDWKDRWGEPRMEPWCFLELHCTTTAKVSYLRVPPIFSDIMSAIAWTFSMDKKNYQLEVET